MRCALLQAAAAASKGYLVAKRHAPAVVTKHQLHCSSLCWYGAVAGCVQACVRLLET
jgi:hypothetical protein